MSKLGEVKSYLKNYYCLYNNYPDDSDKGLAKLDAFFDVLEIFVDYDTIIYIIEEVLNECTNTIGYERDGLVVSYYNRKLKYYKQLINCN